MFAEILHIFQSFIIISIATWSNNQEFQLKPNSSFKWKVKNLDCNVFLTRFHIGSSSSSNDLNSYIAYKCLQIIYKKDGEI